MIELKLIVPKFALPLYCLFLLSCFLGVSLFGVFWVLWFKTIRSRSENLQSRTKVLKHFRKTSAFYRLPSVISKHIVFVYSQPPSPPFQCYNTLRGHFHLVTTLKRGEGVEMSKLEIEKLRFLTKQVFFGECLNCFCP